MSHRFPFLSRIAIVLGIVALAVSFVPASADAQVQIRGTVGFLTPTGDVKDMLLDGGVDFSGKVLFGLTDQVYLGGGGHLSLFGGQSDGGVDITEGGGRFTMEGMVLVYLLPPDSSVRPYITGSMGFGALGWSYEDGAATVFGTEDDGIGFFYVAPGFGLEFPLSEDIALFGAGRFTLTGYGDETSEDFEWDLDGGHFVEVYGGLNFTL